MADQSNEMGMVERVAAAIIANGIGELCWDVISDEHAEMAMRQARAAIEAMREPTEKMVSDMQDTIRFISDDWFPRDGVVTAWEDAIEAALSHDEVNG